MKQLLSKVSEFQKAFGQGVAVKPTNVSSAKATLRYELMKEENNEYLQACEDNDLVGIADSLGDMLYVLCGTILEHGLQDKIEDIFSEIHESNMSKLDENKKPLINGENGIIDSSKALGKVLKSDNFFEPNLAQFL
jgi:predicted HAD superfamily Cof-like phosphohydrolase